MEQIPPVAVVWIRRTIPIELFVLVVDDPIGVLPVPPGERSELLLWIT